MSQRFIRCVHCGMPHDVMQLVCPATGKAIDRRRVNTSSIPMAHGEGPLTPSRPASQPPPSRPPLPPAGNVSTMPPPNPVRLLTGKTIGGKYLVRAVLGEGGMGTVFEAENLAIGRAVAVKVLHPNQARKKVAVKRFHQEARAAGAIGHPNICEVYDLGTLDDGSPYLVMEKLVGETLADRIASEGGLPFDDVIDVLTQVLSGLVAAHEKGIVHRDIKPENIFLTRRVGCPPVAKLLDFGVSKMISPVLSGEREEDLDLTRTGMVMGTPFYMSPEQARGDRNLDARVDLWACGVILYEALTGRRPFTAANYNALLLQILTTQPRAARELRPALPHGFDEVIEKSMARGREERFQSAAEFQRELQTLRDRHPKVAQMSMGVSDLARQAFTRVRPSTPRQPVAEPVQPPPASPSPSMRRVEVAKRYEPPPPPPPAPPMRDPQDDFPYDLGDETPSSVEIPVLFSETPMSGEQIPHMPNMGMDLGTGDVELLPSSIPPGEQNEDFPTEIQYREREGLSRDSRDVRERGLLELGSSDTDTTERRIDLAHLSIGKRPRVGSLRGANLPPPPAQQSSPSRSAQSSPSLQSPSTQTSQPTQSSQPSFTRWSPEPPRRAPDAQSRSADSSPRHAAPQTQQAPRPQAESPRGADSARKPPESARKPPEFRQTDTERESKRGDFRNTDAEAEDNNATIVQSTSILGSLRRKPVSPDDTVRMDAEEAERAYDDNLSSNPPDPTIVHSNAPTIPRAPKMPR